MVDGIGQRTVQVAPVAGTGRKVAAAQVAFFLARGRADEGVDLAPVGEPGAGAPGPVRRLDRRVGNDVRRSIAVQVLGRAGAAEAADDAARLPGEQGSELRGVDAAQVQRESVPECRREEVLLEGANGKDLGVGRRVVRIRRDHALRVVGLGHEDGVIPGHIAVHARSEFARQHVVVRRRRHRLGERAQRPGRAAHRVRAGRRDDDAFALPAVDVAVLEVVDRGQELRRLQVIEAARQQVSQVAHAGLMRRRESRRPAAGSRRRHGVVARPADADDSAAAVDHQPGMLAEAHRAEAARGLVAEMNPVAARAVRLALNGRPGGGRSVAQVQRVPLGQQADAGVVPGRTHGGWEPALLQRREGPRQGPHRRRAVGDGGHVVRDQLARHQVGRVVLADDAGVGAEPVRQGRAADQRCALVIAQRNGAREARRAAQREDIGGGTLARRGDQQVAVLDPGQHLHRPAGPQAHFEPADQVRIAADRLAIDPRRHRRTTDPGHER